MKVICDVHLPKRLVAFFAENGIEAIHGSEILELIKVNLGNISNDRLINIFKERLPQILHALKNEKIIIEINENMLRALLKTSIFSANVAYSLRSLR